jgi:hypothetical protein
LSLGIDGVESQRRLATPADAGDDYQGVAWYGKVDVFQVVLSSTKDLKVFVFAKLVHGCFRGAKIQKTDDAAMA